MKVMCFTDKYHINERVPKIPIGERVTALRIIYDPEGLLYDIQEYERNMYGEKVAYDVRQFIPVSDIDETELAEQRELQTV